MSDLMIFHSCVKFLEGIGFIIFPYFLYVIAGSWGVNTPFSDNAISMSEVI